MEDSAEENFPPEVRDRLSKNAEAVGAFDGLPVEQPVDDLAVIAFQHAIVDGRGAIGRGDAIARDAAAALLDVHDRAGEIDREEDRLAGADFVFEQRWEI